MAASFDDQFEAWLSDRLRNIKDLASRQFTSLARGRSRTSRSQDAMSRSMSSPAGNYYKFVYEDDDDSGDDNDNELPPISPVVDEPEMSPTDVEFGERRQRLSRLLGREAMLALDLADSEPGDLDQPDNVPRPELDENLNRKVGVVFMPRAQDYSTTSLEFSDMESLVSDSIGRQSDEDDVWSRPKHHSVEELQLDREPHAFVEFTPASEDNVDDVDNRTTHSRWGRRGLKQPRYDQLVTVRYQKDDLTDADINHGDFIDDDALMHRFPPGNDDIVTSLPVRTAGGSQPPMTGMLPTDLTEMTMDESCDIHATRDRDPIVRVDDPDYYLPRHSKSVLCCRVSPRTACQRRLFITAGLTALLTALAVLAILAYLVVTRPPV